MVRLYSYICRLFVSGITCNFLGEKDSLSIMVIFCSLPARHAIGNYAMNYRLLAVSTNFENLIVADAKDLLG
jgi:hypothetical protein